MEPYAKQMRQVTKSQQAMYSHLNWPQKRNKQNHKDLLWASSLGLSLAFNSSSNSTDMGTQIFKNRQKIQKKWSVHLMSRSNSYRLQTVKLVTEELFKALLHDYICTKEKKYNPVTLTELCKQEWILAQKQNVLKLTECVEDMVSILHFLLLR